MEITRTVADGFFLSQSLYVKDMLKRTAELVSVTPIDHKIRLHKDFIKTSQSRSKQVQMTMVKDGVKVGPGTPYREVMGSLLWLVNASYPDILNDVSTVANYFNDPRVAHWQACKRISSYLQNVGRPAGYFSSKQSRDVDIDLVSYVNADFTNAIADKHFVRATYSICLMALSVGAIALSSMEVVYRAASTASTATREAFWIKYLAEELSIIIQFP